MTRQLIALATSLLTLYGMKLAGDKRSTGWLVGLINQALWFLFIVAFDAWGLLPLNLALVVIYSRNLRRWRRDERIMRRMEQARLDLMTKGEHDLGNGLTARLEWEDG